MTEKWLHVLAGIEAAQGVSFDHPHCRAALEAAQACLDTGEGAMIAHRAARLTEQAAAAEPNARRQNALYACAWAAYAASQACSDNEDIEKDAITDAGKAQLSATDALRSPDTNIDHGDDE